MFVRVDQPVLGTRSSEPSPCGHVGRRFSAWRHGHKCLETPIQHLGNVDFSIFTYRQEVSPGKLPWRVSRFSEGAKNFPILIEFENPVVATVSHPNVWIQRDEQAVSVSNARPLRCEIAVPIEDLDSLVLSVPNVNPALLIDRDAMGPIEFTRRSSVFAPCLKRLAVAIKSHHARVAGASRLERWPAQ